MQLLKKTITSYFIFSVVILLVAIPVFYFALKKMMVASVDENLIATKTRIMPQLLNAAAGNNEGNLNFPGYDIILKKEQPGKKGDSLYNNESADSYRGASPNRLLASHFYINQESYRVEIKTSLVDRYLLIQRIILVSAVLLVALLLGLLAINRMLTKKIWQPFYHTLKRLQEYRVDKQPVLKLEPSSVSEFNDLNKAIEQLTERNYQVYSSQKEFTENASHEMQSPLAVFQSKLELLMQTKPLNEDQAALITDLANASKRMARLNKSLILLTKIDNDQFLEKETVSIKDTLQKLVQQYEFQIQQQSIHLHFNDTEDNAKTDAKDSAKDIVVEANKTLIEILLGNLLSNAIRHNIPNGSIEITLKAKELTIRNSGRPSSLDTNKLFQRFQKESPDANSIGLGLEIVKKISKLNHYSIQYQFDNQMHVFSVRF
ncbi:MAG TPA: HAMP domain-containing sensor histidine kinase [Puia sp.]